MQNVTDMDTGEVTFEKIKTPEDYKVEGQLMDFADGSDGGSNIARAGASFYTISTLVMASYRSTYKDKLTTSLEPATGDGEPKGDTILEGQTGELIFATLAAENLEEVQEKAKRFSLDLQTGKIKRDL